MNTIEIAIATCRSYPYRWAVDGDDQIASPYENVRNILDLGCLTHGHKELLSTLPPAPMASPGNFRGSE